MAMITTAQHSHWPGDVLLLPGATGLQKQCLLRMKLFTLDNRLIVKVVGKLSGKERQKARTSLEQSLSL
jgi:mRNA interferase MazF